MKTRIFIVFIFLSFGAAAFSNAEKVKVFVSIIPQEYFVERVGGDRVEVKALVRPGSSPATYSVTPSQMTELSKASILFITGVPFENGLIPRIKKSFKTLRIVDTTAGIKLRNIEKSDSGHQDHHECGHSHNGRDPHVWLSPVLVKTQAETICKALCVQDPKGTDVYKKNLEQFSKELDVIHKKLAAALAPLKERELFVFHPAYGYFADAYGLKQVAVEAGGKEPSARQLVSLIKKAQKQKVRVVFVQPQFSDKSARIIAREINGTVCKLDPLARDYIKNMNRIAKNIKDGLSNKSK